MAIRDESTSSNELLRDARFHRASVTADKKAKDLAPLVKSAEVDLRKARDEHEEQEDVRAEKLAILLRTDFDLDELVILVELEVLAAVGKDRKHRTYIACFPNGLTAVIALRGEAEALAVRVLVKELPARLPDVAAKHAENLEALAKASVVTEQEWKSAEVDAAQAGALEKVARIQLVRQLQKNEGVLLSIYPGQRKRVRSYFRPVKRSKSKKGTSGSTDT